MHEKRVWIPRKQLAQAADLPLQGRPVLPPRGASTPSPMGHRGLALALRVDEVPLGQAL